MSKGVNSSSSFIKGKIVYWERETRINADMTHISTAFGHDPPQKFILRAAGQNFSDMTLSFSVKYLRVSTEPLVCWASFSEPTPVQCRFLLEICLVGCSLINFSGFPDGLGGN